MGCVGGEGGYHKLEREAVLDEWWELGRDVLRSCLNWSWSGGRIVSMKWIEWKVATIRHTYSRGRLIH